MKPLIAIDIGGSSVKLALGNAKGKIFKKEKIVSGKNIEPEILLKQIKEKIVKLITSFGTPLAIAVGAPGPVDNVKGEIVSSGNLPKLQNFPLKEVLEKKFSCPVFLENDANLAGLGEYYFGKAKQYNSVLFYTLGTGVGGSFIHNGELFTGWRGNSMEIGHTAVRPDGLPCSCGRKGCLEAYSSMSGIHRQLAYLFPKKELPFSMKKLVTMIEIKKELDVILESAGFHLGLSAGNFIQLLVPDLILITGGLAMIWDKYKLGFEKALEQTTFPVFREQVKIKVMSSGADSGLLGGLALARVKVKG